MTDIPLILDGANIWSEADLNTRMHKLAAWLKAAGLQEGASVGVRMRPRAEWFVINRALGTLGCNQVLFDTKLTPSELAPMLSRSGVVALFLDDAAPTELNRQLEGALPIGVIGVHAGAQHLFADLVDGSSVQPECATDREAPLMFFTSGTTGTARGVRRDGGATFGNSAALRAYKFDLLFKRYGLTGVRRELVNLPLHHGMGSMAAQVCLRSKAQMVIQRRFDPEQTLALIDRHRITSWSCVPTMLFRISQLPKAVLGRYDVSSLRALNVGAAACSVQLKQWAWSYFGPVLSEGYGLTETGPATVLLPADFLARPSSCGRPLRNVDLRVVEPDGAVCPVGTEGLIEIRSPMLGQEMTDGAPIRANLSEDGFLRTGDIGQLDADGYLYVTGRQKDLIIKGGVNIHPREIEDCLSTHPELGESAVVGRPDPEYGETIVAFCETRPGCTPDAAGLIAFLRPLLSAHKLPREFHFVDPLPRTSTGKVRKVALRQRLAQSAQP